MTSFLLTKFTGECTTPGEQFFDINCLDGHRMLFWSTKMTVGSFEKTSANLYKISLKCYCCMLCASQLKYMGKVLPRLKSERNADIIKNLNHKVMEQLLIK